ncbi:MAG TPA: response regulator [Abditibacteriaceae bacterium]|jgi:CheY-like chemotaxis protein
MQDPKHNSRVITILVADDDEDDLRLVTDAFKATDATLDLRYAENGEELLNYLHRQGAYGAPSASPLPALILLDLNMPVKDGREALAEIKSDPRLRRIPVVVLTTSEAKEDIQASYDLGVNSFITKPSTYTGLIKLMRTLYEYWIKSVQLPLSGANGHN